MVLDLAPLTAMLGHGRMCIATEEPLFDRILMKLPRGITDAPRQGQAESLPCIPYLAEGRLNATCDGPTFAPLTSKGL